MAKRKYEYIQPDSIGYRELYDYYFFRLCNVALAQFEYENLPESIDRRYMEKCLLYRGSVAVYEPEDMDFWVATGFMPWQFKNRKPSRIEVDKYLDFSKDYSVSNLSNVFNIYGNPTHITGLGFNAEQITPSEGKWGVLYDTMTREPIIMHIRNYAKLLAECHMTYRMNLRLQNKPYLIASTINKKATFVQFFRDLFDFKPAVMVDKSQDIKNDIDVLDLRVDFKGTELLDNLKTIWNEALSMLGISAGIEKKERMITDEADLEAQSDIIALNTRLLNRKEFWDKMNREFGLNVKVKLSSVNFNLEKMKEEVEINGALYNEPAGNSEGGQPER